MLSRHFFQRVLLATLLLASAAGAADLAVGGSNGNPFRPPASPVLSIYDYRNLDNVSDALEEFLSLNEELPGSVKPATVSADDAVRRLQGLFADSRNQAFLRAVGQLWFALPSARHFAVLGRLGFEVREAHGGGGAGRNRKQGSR